MLTCLHSQFSLQALHTKAEPNLYVIHSAACSFHRKILFPPFRIHSLLVSNTVYWLHQGISVFRFLYVLSSTWQIKHKFFITNVKNASWQCKVFVENWFSLYFFGLHSSGYSRNSVNWTRVPKLSPQREPCRGFLSSFNYITNFTSPLSKKIYVSEPGTVLLNKYMTKYLTT
jgi:hypothetical protein